MESAKTKVSIYFFAYFASRAPFLDFSNVKESFVIKYHDNKLLSIGLFRVILSPTNINKKGGKKWKTKKRMK